jgi:hypothetical protein
MRAPDHSLFKKSNFASISYCFYISFTLHAAFANNQTHISMNTMVMIV